MFCNLIRPAMLESNRAAASTQTLGHSLDIPMPMPKATKLLILVALFLMLCAAISFVFGPRYALYRDPNLACCSEIEIGGGWIRLGQIFVLVAIALVVAAVRMWFQTRDARKHDGVL